ncbi:DUF4097 family beta strand repeat-containing protein [Aeromicrobium massiliense]|uniref:DUF4097 family beta strand repeat-containing protein n=1 Tax=Aeromicrobium massiliense TaxID=1464554 RepID=UPI00057867EC|nr:DUF4097 family beta strand repeat-containing protein [Aeromicrobium massiliense]
MSHSGDDDTIIQGAVPAEQVGDYDVASPESRTLVTVVGTILGALVLVGVFLLVSLAMRDTRVESQVIDLDGSAQVVLQATNADVRLVPGDGEDIRVRAEVDESLLSTDFELRRSGDAIAVAADCITWLSPGCGAEVTVEVPDGVPVEVTTTSGRAEVRDLETDVLVRTGSGDVVVGGKLATVSVTTGSGSVSSRDLDAVELKVVTGSGDVDAVLVEQPYALAVKTDSGDVEATLPDGERTYQVKTSSDDGDVTSDLEDDPDGEGLVSLQSDSGDVTLAVR